MSLHSDSGGRHFDEDLEEEFNRAYHGTGNGKAKDEANGKAADAFAVWSLDDMLDLEPPSWVVEGHVPLGGRLLDFAPSGQHKTNLAVDQGCHIAHGLSWHGHAVAAHPVIIVATEDPHGAAMRVVGWHDYHGMPGGRVLIVPGGEFRLNDPDGIKRLKATAAEHFPGERVGFIVDHYDVSVEGDPTSTEIAKGAAEGLRALGDGAAFVQLLAHCPWTADERAKVPVTLWANVDARRKVERNEVTGNATLKLLHQKNGRSGAVLKFEFETHKFATRKGEATCLIARRLLATAEEPPKAEKDKLGDNEKLVLEILAAAISDKGRDIPPSHDIPRGMRGIPFEEWEAAAERYMPPDKEGFRWRRDFKRAVNSLRAKYRYRLANGWVWLRKDEGAGL